MLLGNKSIMESVIITPPANDRHLAIILFLSTLIYIKKSLSNFGEGVCFFPIYSVNCVEL